VHVRLPAHRKANITARAIPWITVQAAGQIANAAATIGDFPYEARFGHCSSTRVRWRMVRRISGRCLVMRSKMRRPCPGCCRRTTARPPAARPSFSPSPALPKITGWASLSSAEFGLNRRATGSFSPVILHTQPTSRAPSGWGFLLREPCCTRLVSMALHTRRHEPHQRVLLRPASPRKSAP
jgi:hypothetical protein